MTIPLSAHKYENDISGIADNLSAINANTVDATAHTLRANGDISTSVTVTAVVDVSRFAHNTIFVETTNAAAITTGLTLTTYARPASGVPWATIRVESGIISGSFACSLQSGALATATYFKDIKILIHNECSSATSTMQAYLLSRT